MKSERGFSLIELMVSLVIGMLAVVFVMRAMINFETNRRQGAGGSDAMQNGVAALLAIETETSQAGWGLNHPQLSGCTATFSDSMGFQLANVGGVNPTPLAPVVINANATAGNPDTISIYSGSSFAGANFLQLFTDTAAGATTIDLNDPRAFGFKNRDVLVLAQNNGLCAVVEASAAPVQVAIGASTISRVNISGARFSPLAGLPSAYPSNSNRTLVFNLGTEASLAFHTWSIVNGRLMLRATNLAGSSAATEAVASNIVSIKALYGFDTRVGAAWTPDSGLTVTQWSRTMIDADGNATVGNQGDYQRIAAVRLAIVSRSREPQKVPAGGCDTTPDAPVVFSTQEPSGIATIPITLNVDVAGAPTDYWKCYQYRVFETIVPLRNAGWRPGS